MQTRKSTDSGAELNLRHLHCREFKCRRMITATSTTMKELQLRHLHGVCVCGRGSRDGGGGVVVVVGRGGGGVGW